VSTGYNPVEGDRRASRNGLVSDLPPEILNATIRKLIIRCTPVDSRGRFYMTMFQAASNAACAKAPGFLVPVRVPLSKAMLSRGHLPILQAIFFGLYSFFFNINKLNKAIAMMLFSVMAAVLKIPPSWKRPFKLVSAQLKRSIRWVRTHPPTPAPSGVGCVS
jgi:hypothetical protein